jgi:hypothetical protein
VSVIDQEAEILLELPIGIKKKRMPAASVTNGFAIS